MNSGDGLEIDANFPSLEEGDDRAWRGVPLERIYRGLGRYELRHFHEVRPAEAHVVLYNLPIDPNGKKPPKPRRSHTKWDANHVRLPYSHRNQYPVEQEDGNTTLVSRWELVQKALLQPIGTSRELEKAILSYNTKGGSWKFNSLHKLFEEDLEEEESAGFFEYTLPKMIRLALSLPDLIPAAIPLLKQGSNKSISLTQEQVACLLANAFLCTFPRRNSPKKKSEYSMFPDINFNRLFQFGGQSVLEKIKCICNYFRRVCSKMPTGVLTFQRRYFGPKQFVNWNKCGAVIGRNTVPMHINSEGTIEDQGRGLLQVDFANKYIGGGVLGHGCVQEEIRFVINPELLVSKLFTEALKHQEALIMMGSEQFSEYNGYASSFSFAGDFQDETPRDASGRRECYITAIDALHFVQSIHQYREELILRELNKAYVGYFHPLSSPAPGVATGNWGCGAFGGDANLKAMLQLMVCCVLNRPLAYYTFGDSELRDQIYAMYTFLVDNKVRVCDIWRSLKEFRGRSLPSSELYAYFYQDYYDKKSKPQKNPNPFRAILDDENLVNLMNQLVDKIESQQQPCASSSSSLDSGKKTANSPSSKPVPSPKKSSRVSLIAELDRTYYSAGPGPAKKLCPSTSQCLTLENGNDDDEVVIDESVSIQIEEEEQSVEPADAVKYESDTGEFVDGTPPEELRKTQQNRKISDYFSKSDE